jgi:hypothetical protein
MRVMRVMRMRITALLTCLTLGIATFASMQVGAAEAVQQWGKDWGSIGFGLIFVPHDKDCADFDSHEAAQEHFESYGRPHRDPHELDPDGDLVACERLLR